MPAMAQEDTELTLAEVAASLRVSEDTARKLVSSGEITGGRKQGRQWRVLRSAVEEYKQRQRDGRKKRN